jgi:hypothetical protein
MQIPQRLILVGDWGRFPVGTELEVLKPWQEAGPQSVDAARAAQLLADGLAELLPSMNVSVESDPEAAPAKPRRGRKKAED